MYRAAVSSDATVRTERCHGTKVVAAKWLHRARACIGDEKRDAQGLETADSVRERSQDGGNTDGRLIASIGLSLPSVISPTRVSPDRFSAIGMR